MKKLFTLLLLSTFLFSCGDDDDDPNNEPQYIPESDWKGDWNNPEDATYKPEYNGKYNPIGGKWKLIKENGADVEDLMVYYFNDERDWRWGSKYLGEDKGIDYSGWYRSYAINNESFKSGKRVYKYTFSRDSLKLNFTDGVNTWEVERFDDGLFVWNGNWNSKDDPHYQIYNGKYNPIEGIWKTIPNHSAQDIFYNKYEYKDGDFYTSTSYSLNGTYRDMREYAINDTGIRELEDRITYKTYTFRYWITKENGKDILRLKWVYNKTLIEYERVK